MTLNKKFKDELECANFIAVNLIWFVFYVSLEVLISAVFSMMVYNMFESEYTLLETVEACVAGTAVLSFLTVPFFALLVVFGLYDENCFDENNINYFATLVFTCLIFSIGCTFIGPLECLIGADIMHLGNKNNFFGYVGVLMGLIPSLATSIFIIFSRYIYLRMHI
jgi:hypothetical protein